MKDKNNKIDKDNKDRRLFIYDIDEKDEDIFSGVGSDDFLFSASPAVKSCIGCFGCWIKTPGKCVLKDRCSVIPSYISKSSEIIIVTPLLYGGYSSNIKAVLDRSIGYVLPYFQIVSGEMHHKMRYQNPFKLSVYFYGECDNEEKDIAQRLVKANAVNLGAGSYDVYFYDSVDSIRKVIG